MLTLMLLGFFRELRCLISLGWGYMVWEGEKQSRECQQTHSEQPVSRHIDTLQYLGWGSLKWPSNVRHHF
jgi:hypothetical protein